MDTDPQEITFGEEIQPSAPVQPYQWPDGKKIAILTPTLGHPSPGYTESLAQLFERDKMKLKIQPTNFIVRGRNQLAEWFISQSECEWSFWWDDDIGLCFGDVPWFHAQINNPAFPAQYARLHPIGRLISHGRRFIGGCYFGRHPAGLAQFAQAFVSRAADDAAHNGPRDLIQEVNWVGFGAVLIHRQVFLDIIKNQPQIEIRNVTLTRQLGFKYRFFNQTSLYGEHDDDSEDVAFCERARLAGHSIFVDYAVVPAHYGRVGYSYHNTRRAAPVIT